MKKLLENKVAAPLVGVSPGTLENWRVKGLGPKFIKVSAGQRGKVVYDPDDIAEWKAARRFQSTSDAEVA